MFTVAESAQRTRVCESVVRAWLKQGLAHYRVGAKGRRGKILIAVQDLDDWMAGLKVQRGPIATRQKSPPLKHLKL